MTRALSSVESAADDIASEARSNVESGSEYDPSPRLVPTANDATLFMGLSERRNPIQDSPDAVAGLI